MDKGSSLLKEEYWSLFAAFISVYCLLPRSRGVEKFRTG